MSRSAQSVVAALLDAPLSGITAQPPFSMNEARL